MIYIGIDPGVSGGIAALDEAGRVIRVVPMPDTPLGIWSALHTLPREGGVQASLERVWSSPGWGHAGSFRFGCNYGDLRMALTALWIPFEEVLPRTWQKAFGIAYEKGMTDTQKKNLTKSRALGLFPGRTITHALADALLVAEYGRRRGSRDGEEVCEEGR